MNLIERFRKIVRAADASWSSEKPEALFDTALADMQRLQSEARIEVTQAMAKAKRLERDYYKQLNSRELLLRKVAEALRQDQEALARTTLERKRSLDELISKLELELSKQKTLIPSLKHQLHELSQRIQALEHKRETFLLKQRFSDEFEGFAESSSAPEAIASHEQPSSKLSLEEELTALKANLDK